MVNKYEGLTEQEKRLARKVAAQVAELISDNLANGDSKLLASELVKEELLKFEQEVQSFNGTKEGVADYMKEKFHVIIPESKIEIYSVLKRSKQDVLLVISR